MLGSVEVVPAGCPLIFMKGLHKRARLLGRAENNSWIGPSEQQLQTQAYVVVYRNLAVYSGPGSLFD